MLEIGKKIGQRYKVIRLIGTGGMANVYLGHDLILDRDVAVKVLRFDFQNNTDALRRFQREALSATQLVHQNIVSVYDVDEENGLQYIVMEYVKGTDLKKYIENSGKVSPQNSIHIMNQVLSAMALAHQNRIIHRDIKPQNILIDEDNHVKVTDFGIAIALSDTSITQTNTLLGSVHYLSPEQARGGMATTKSDVYALGIVLYELLSGKVPFDGESAVSVALKHFQEEMPSIRKEHPEIPQSLENIILKATAKEPIDRYQTCEEMLADLDTALDPSRENEVAFIPASMLNETKVMQPITPPLKKEEMIPTEEKTPIYSSSSSENKKESSVNNQKKKKRGPLFLLFSFLFLAVFVISYMVWNNREPEPVMVPDIVNVNEDTAKRLLEQENLIVGEVFEEYDDTISETFTIRTEPAVGSSVPFQSEVDLFISLGKKPTTVESYLGESYSDVRDRLKELGFVVERLDRYDEQEEAGVIIGQSIEDGTDIVADGEMITLTVSMGKEAFTMADLKGYTKVSVQDYVDQYGLDVDFIEEASDEIAEGLVISQSISPQSNFTRGETITVTLSTGVAQAEYVLFSKTITIPYDAAIEKESSDKKESSSESNESNKDDANSAQSIPKSNHIVVSMQDADHQIDEIFREFDISKDQEITLNFRIIEGEKGAYQVERDGEIILEEKELTK
ncbi:Stk1 family PASTA domain-containing Ser/Thr kinase [Jeotgalibaca sp. MA1X17-3]|uniref:Stk1 family PASTA domain-containing Ser/Thr kinase n=1 Tax=Jeotgalibaca sp. MA1X17-3 TaxID=2908211 RepID=UPI001F45A28D|nr:Stk1 family PASTA domain-containing Ser/Thr kinase [Jeotgalibaca sp. MA1X17-3]UJF14941.1 Stk1 family PASTA domain-containing Ser/Thr kinase [Jeotgalibaca sp. MA1X17-3]